ncbi:V-type ATPase, F subunit [Anncaliia algerae PRA109]|nr:V-type ATPase, F subunit [Anncaliia algerae PRA109]
MVKQSIIERTIIAILADEDTIRSFSLTGIPSFKEPQNFITVTHDTLEEDLVTHFNDLISRKDVAILFIADFVAQKIQKSIDKYKEILPSLIEIPSRLGKNKFY